MQQRVSWPRAPWEGILLIATNGTKQYHNDGGARIFTS